MTGLVVVLALVVAAFVAASAARGRGYGLVSGSEFLLVGVAIGPQALGVLDEEMLAAVRPGMILVVAWLGLLFGLRQRRARLRALGARGALAVVVEAGGTLALIATALPSLMIWLGRPAPSPLSAWCVALVAAPSTKSTIAWARARLSARGRVIDWLEAVTRHDDIVSLLALVAIVTLVPPASQAAPLIARTGTAALVTLGLGVALGAAFTLLGGRRVDRDTAWVLLTGLMLLGAGVATRLGLPTIVVSYLVGVTIAATTESHALLDEIDAQTERPVVLLLLMLVGARVSFDAGVAWVAAAVALRLGGKLTTGELAGRIGGGGARAGEGLLGFGGVALAIAAQIDLVYGAAAGPILAVTAALALVGDVAGALSVRALLQRAGEIGAADVGAAASADVGAAANADVGAAVSAAPAGGASDGAQP